MKNLILKIYDRFKRTPALWIALLTLLTCAATWSFLSLNYSEDISEFLPVDNNNQTALSVYQDISGANKVIAIISLKDTAQTNPDRVVECVDRFAERLQDEDTCKYVQQLMYQIDMDMIMQVADDAYDNVPYFLSEADYARADSLLNSPNYVTEQLHNDKQMLMFPSSSIVGANIQRDPLNLFVPILSRLQKAAANISYGTYDNYIFSPDMKRAVVLITSPFGANETENNAKLVSFINDVKDETVAEFSDTEVHIFGGPSIAVGNAQRIKTDSVLTSVIAGLLILLLLIVYFRSVKKLLLIVVSVGWGWIIAMGAISVLYDSVSIIVLGIASVILGLAVNYPLHLLSHLKDAPDARTSLKEVVTPLLIGNVTTVGAFLTLTPLQSSALRNLGIFSSLLLVCTLLFVLLFLPQIVKGGKTHKDTPLISGLADARLESKRWLLVTATILTLVFAYFSKYAGFDADMRNINYMTDEQRADMAYFQNMLSADTTTQSLYVMTTGKSWDEILQRHERLQPCLDSLMQAKLITDKTAVSSYLSSSAKQREKIECWNKFIADHHEQIYTELPAAAASLGFSEDAFEQFNDIISRTYEVKDIDEFADFTSTALQRNISYHNITGHPSVVEILTVPNANINKVANIINAHTTTSYCFDLLGMNQAIANNLSKDFNYIGIACSIIVFILLLLAFRNLEFAIISFVPMAISWIWILGIMGLLGIKFNIVNVVLATFIFGQGADYAIFMTEGLAYEYAYRRGLLKSYKGTIVVSALIMFIAIGTLIISQHPAMRSLAEVTIVGMASVVFISYLVPPLIFNWLVRKNGQVRHRPVTIRKILNTTYCAVIYFTQLTTAYILGFILFKVFKKTDKTRLLFHRYTTSVFRWDINQMAGIRSQVINTPNETFEKPAIVICNHQSMLDSMCLLVLSPKLLFVANQHASKNPVIRIIFKWFDYYSINDDFSIDDKYFKTMLDLGYSIVIFPEGARPEVSRNSIMRFHKGAFQIAMQMQVDILPIYIHGIKDVMPKGDEISHGGEIYIEVGNRVSYETLEQYDSCLELAKDMRHKYIAHYDEICRRLETTKYFHNFVLDKYRYKGSKIMRHAQNELKTFNDFSAWIDGKRLTGDAIVINPGQGEFALMLALMNRNVKINVITTSDEQSTFISNCCTNFVKNINICDESFVTDNNLNTHSVFIIKPSDEDYVKYKNSNNVTFIKI